MQRLATALALMCALLAFTVSERPAAAHETDQFTLPDGRPFADVGRYMNEWAYDAISNGVRKVNARIAQELSISRGPSSLEQQQTPEAIVRAVNAEFGNAYDVIEGLERQLHSSKLKDRYPGKVVGYKQQLGNIYQHVHFPLDPRQFFRLWHSSTFMAYGTYVGTDKIGHFTDMGMHYYRAFMNARSRGAGDKLATADAVRVGTHGPLFSERGMVGFGSAGHYSNGDLAANYLGLLFYRNLTEPVMIKGELQPAMLERDGDFWRLAPHVRRTSDFFAIFISDHLDEALNPGLFEKSMRDAIRDAVRKRSASVLARRSDHHGNRRTKEYYDAILKEMRTYYGVDYGHEGEYDELVSIGNTCFESFPDDALVSSRDMNGQTPLHHAAALGDVETVKRLVSMGANVNALVRSEESYNSEWGSTPLHFAARDGRIDVVRYLIERGAAVNAQNDRGITPLHRSLAYRDLTEVLIAKGAQINIADARGSTPLHWAAEDGQAEAAELLISHGANVRQRNHAGCTPLHLAARHGNVDTAMKLITYGSDVNAKTNTGLTPLHLAVVSGSEAMVDLLVSLDADAEGTDQFGWTALHEAADRGLAGAVGVLLTKRLNVNAKDVYGNTPLHVASRRGHEALIADLLGQGASINAQNARQATPLHEAVFSGNERLVDMLLKGGANRIVKDAAGLTPVQIASQQGNSQIVTLLRETDVNTTPAAVRQN